MLRALSEYYKYLSRQENSQLVEKGFSKVLVNFNMILKKDGTLKEIVPYTQKVLKGKKEAQIPREEIFPFRFSVSATNAETIDHREKYNFGIVWDKSIENDNKLTITENSLLSFQYNKEKNLDFLSDLSSPVIDAYKLFLNSWEPKEQLENSILLELGKKYEKSKFIITLEYENKPLHKDIQVVEKWRNLFNEDKPQKDTGGKLVQCSISGNKVLLSQIPKTHAILKGVKGGQASGTCIVSFNQDAFCSYNKKKSANSFISKEIEQQYTESFNYLSTNENHRQYIDGMTFLYWAMTDKDEKPYLDMFDFSMGFSRNAKLTDEELTENISTLLKNLSQGKSSDWKSFNINENTEFYIMGVTPTNASRLSIKIFEHNNFGKLMENVSKHHFDMQMDKNDKPLALWQIEKELKSPISNNELSPNLNVKLLQSILKNTPYPQYLLNTVIGRVKTDHDNEKKKFNSINRNRVRIIRAYLIRKNIIKGEDTTMLNTENKDIAYNCGRLFAILEQIQASATSIKINATIKDKFFASACSTPYLIFPKLIKLSQNHLAKIEGGLKVYYDKLIEDVISNLGDSFPRTFNMEKQGVFILGYYQQKQDFYTKKTNK